MQLPPPPHTSLLLLRVKSISEKGSALQSTGKARSLKSIMMIRWSSQWADSSDGCSLLPPGGALPEQTRSDACLQTEGVRLQTEHTNAPIEVLWGENGICAVI